MAYADPLDPRNREARRRHYDANKQQYFDRNKAKKASLRKYVLELKNKTSCTDCGVIFVDEPWLTEFDHVSGEKTASIAKLMGYGSMNRLIKELALCELVCVICHRRRTAKRAGYKIEWMVEI